MLGPIILRNKGFVGVQSTGGSWFRLAGVPKGVSAPLISSEDLFQVVCAGLCFNQGGL